ncbi:hypothetical protein SELMODRAFT_105500 [Selaginella moellendorffii]|uniref:Germin-like protein n=1 Tax=Selaginella moellendorffii TaxID=88036 RepID=D8S0C3_SELML|nr:hypothetical protein SELMODRAFT_105500 [Selaginella moellendorffii]
MSTLQVLTSDPDTVRDFCVVDLDYLQLNKYPYKPYANVTIDDFVFSGLLTPADPSLGPSGTSITPAFNRKTLMSTWRGVSCNRLDFVEGVLILPHMHPCASKFIYITQGRLYTGFIDTANRAFVSSSTSPSGKVMILSRGLIHLQLNIGEGPVSAFAVLNSEKPRFQTIAPSMLGIGVMEEVLQKAFWLDARTVNRLVEEFVPIAEFIRGMVRL